MLKKFNDLIVNCAKNGYSDLHIIGGQPIVYRKEGVLKYSSSQNWTYQDVDTLVKNILNYKQMEMLRQRLSVDFAVSVQHIRIRINIFSTVRGLSLAIRLLPGAVPTLDKLNLHPSLQTISDLKSGLVLICGTTGCGKTTTIASILEDINHKRAAHIITLEDPIEYRIKSNKSFIEQREIGTHVPSIERGLIDVMRADPDVIMVGELRDPETIILTLNAAESGHLVIGTLHATNMEDAIYRLINSVPSEAEEYIRFQLASTISWIIVQQFIYLEKAGFRIPLLSIMRGTQQIKGIIREKKLYQMDNAMHTSKIDGMFTPDRYLKEYLDSREKFYNPVVYFKPSEEKIVDNTFHSSIFDKSSSEKSVTETSTDHLKKNVKENINDQGKLLEEHTLVINDNYDSHYVIDESADLEEIIAQTETKFTSKK